MSDYGANLRAQAGALEELLYSHSDEITQLVDVSGVRHRCRWHLAQQG
jgi:hypothetical protein